MRPGPLFVAVIPDPRLRLEALAYASLPAKTSPNQVLTHAARAAAKQPFQPPLVAARGAREGLWLEQSENGRRIIIRQSYVNHSYSFCILCSVFGSGPGSLCLPDVVWPAAAERQPRARSARRGCCRPTIFPT